MIFLSDKPKRAPFTGALFYFLVASLGLSTNVDAGTCRLDRADEAVQVEYVHDGDSIRLHDGRKIRIIGINAPEVARDPKPAEALANKARDRLRQLLKNKPQIQLRHGREKYDRYNRLLAHVYLADGRNVSEQLLTEGLAYALTVPPNLWQLDCYRQAEQAARKNKKGLWAKKLGSVLEANALSGDTRGFQIIRGRVSRIGNSKYSMWLNFNRQFAVRIHKDDLRWFKSMDLDKLKGKQLEVRGWVQYHKRQLRMRVKHPAAIHILP